MAIKTLADLARRTFIGGSDARIIMGDDENALLRLWREKRGEVEPEDLSGNLIVQLGVVTEDLNRRWYEAIQANDHRHSAADAASNRCAGWQPPSTAEWRRPGRIRSQVHAALVVLGRSGGRNTCRSCSTICG